jgi:hypothetical protein
VLHDLIVIDELGYLPFNQSTTPAGPRLDAKRGRGWKRIDTVAIAGEKIEREHALRQLT